VLEGQVTETGIAYVLKRKLTNLKNLFKFKHSREYLLLDSLERARRAEYVLQQKAIEVISDVIYEDPSQDPNSEIDQPTVIRKEEDESEP
jgi:hypothetical protein